MVKTVNSATKLSEFMSFGFTEPRQISVLGRRLERSRALQTHRPSIKPCAGIPRLRPYAQLKRRDNRSRAL